MKSARSEIGISVEAAKLAKLARRLKGASAFAHSALPALWFLTDDARTPNPLGAARLLPPGSGLILRHYQAPDRAALAFALSRLAHERSLTLLIGADAALAAQVNAHGVHIPRWAAARRAGPRRLGVVTASAHGLGEIRRAQAIGADAIFLGPVFATRSHEGAQGLGAVRFFALARQSPLPVFALGGIGPLNAGLLKGSAAAGMGAVGALIPSTDN